MPSISRHQLLQLLKGEIALSTASTPLWKWPWTNSPWNSVCSTTPSFEFSINGT